MAVLGKLSGPEKVAWILLLLGFFFVEMKSLNKQHLADEYENSFTVLQETAQFSHVRNAMERHVTENQSQFDATMAEMKGGPGYVNFIVTACCGAELPVMMMNNTKQIIRDVNLEIISVPELGTAEELRHLRYTPFNPKLVTIGDVSPGFQHAPFTLAPGNYNIRITTRDEIFNELLKVSVGPSVPGGWDEDSCIVKNGTTKVLLGECPKP